MDSHPSKVKVSRARLGEATDDHRAAGRSREQGRKSSPARSSQEGAGPSSEAQQCPGEVQEMCICDLPSRRGAEVETG